MGFTSHFHSPNLVPSFTFKDFENIEEKMSNSFSLTRILPKKHKKKALISYEIKAFVKGVNYTIKCNTLQKK